MSEENTQCQVMLDGEQLEQVSYFKYSGYMSFEKGMDKAKGGREVTGAIKSLVNTKAFAFTLMHLRLDPGIKPGMHYGAAGEYAITGVNVWQKDNDVESEV